MKFVVAIGNEGFFGRQLAKAVGYKPIILVPSIKCTYHDWWVHKVAAVCAKHQWAVVHDCQLKLSGKIRGGYGYVVPDFGNVQKAGMVRLEGVGLQFFQHTVP